MTEQFSSLHAFSVRFSLVCSLGSGDIDVEGNKKKTQQDLRPNKTKHSLPLPADNGHKEVPW